MSSPKFAETHNVVAFLEKPEESDGFAEIIDVLKASSVSYALTVNPLQALVDKKRVIVTESSIRRDLHLDDAEGTDCLPTATIFKNGARMGFHLLKKCGERFRSSTDSTPYPLLIKPSSSFPTPKRIKSDLRRLRDRRQRFLKMRQGTRRVYQPFNDPQSSGEDSMQLTKLMVLCTKLQTQVLDLQKAKDAQAKEIAALKKRIQRLERRKISRPTGLKRLRKVGMSQRVESSEDQESLGEVLATGSQ
ncbi:hypothetical protein Tco_0727047 [Tanacetum coccineum]|uniref:Uncharacterized protein n=1 Tax=Tanacetum coccineum TaxID=301880 RepID=A0ABQ4YI94_9ASTR